MNLASQVLAIAVFGWGLQVLTHFLGWNLAFFARRMFTFKDRLPGSRSTVLDAVVDNSAAAPDLGGWPEGQMPWDD